MLRRTSLRPQNNGCSGFWLLLFFLCCNCAFAEDLVLHLRNGDRISGRLLSEGTNGVVLKTGFSENLAIPAGLIERRETIVVTNTPPTVTNRPPAIAETLAPARPASGVAGELVLTNKPSVAQVAAGAPKPPEAKPPEAKPKPPPPSKFQTFISEWHGEAQLGANLGFSTKDREAFTGHIKLTHNHKFPNERSLRNILDYDMAYGTTDDVLSDNRMEGTWKTEYDLSPRFLLYNAAGAGYDEVRGIKMQYDIGPGLGYKWLVRTNFVLKTELGGNYQEQYFTTKEKTERYSLRIAEDTWWQITPKLRWDQKVEFFPELQDFSDYRFRFESNFSYLLKQNLTLTLNVVDLYDTAVPETVSHNDLQIRSLIGIKF